ncbi:uncharacterized protein Dana_GF10547 [Drosophila ananassae]|uniref:F-box domain-containing protein n=1 Tax=Drosophila ananassae TaxID=7217 RepID=B3M4U1_DROAN|nr:uncharacterized protein LOC6493416 [Drosophila ananassae]EDV40515.1 uncharacterized protein Dana_GF10547 [Drosophila ananassae]
MRFRTTLTIEYTESTPNKLGLGFTELNDDCLLLICENLSLGDQLRLLQLKEARLSHLVLRIWARKYANQFDWRKERQLKFLSDDEENQLLDYMSWRTKALLNLPNSSRKWLDRKRKHPLNHIQRLSFRESNTWLIQSLPSVCPNLVDLNLGQGEGIKAADLCLVFGELKHLRGFELRNCPKNDEEFSPRARFECQQLQILKLPACVWRANAPEVFQLPKLRQLTAFLCHSLDPGDDDDDDDVGYDDDKANASGIAILAMCLRHLRGRNCQIVGLRLQCQLDGSLLSAGQDANLFRLQRFAWHSQLTVHYDVADGSIKWLPQRPQVVRRTLLPFLATQADSLRELDFTRNPHATPTFLMQATHLLRPAGTSVWHDACPPHPHPPAHSHAHAHLTDPDAEADIAETNDLALVELELLHLPNEQRNRIPAR